MGESASKIERLKQQIEEECQSMKQDPQGYSVISRHDAINKKYHTLDTYHEQLKTLVGEQEATAILYEIYNRILQ